MADLYTEDATYGWNVGPSDEFMAVGREGMHARWRSGSRWPGLRGGGLPVPKGAQYRRREQGEILGLWKQVADATKADGTNYEIAGLGGSWYRYGGELPVVVAARLLRCRRRRGAVFMGDDPRRRHAPPRHAATHGRAPWQASACRATTGRARRRWACGRCPRGA